MVIEHRYLHLPVKNGAPKRYLRFHVGGEMIRAFEIELAQDSPDFWVFADLAPWLGQRLTIEAEDLAGQDPRALDALSQGDTLREADDLYQEALRPQFHFSSRRGWNNDPNGLMYYRGQYHLFYQHNPYGWKWGNMHWGHTVSADLLHWRELGDALYPDALGTIYSGSGVVDWVNTTGFQQGADAPLVCIYTAAGGTSPESAEQPFTQSLAYSSDGGASWRKYAGSPVLGHLAGRNRDPKVIWHAPTARWIMALYLDKNAYALFASADLKTWTRLQDIEAPGATECPDFFPLAVDGDPAEVKWVFWGANATYLVGRFDGAAFTAEQPAQRYDWCDRATYAAQTWSDIPSEDGRRIQIAWMRAPMPGMPFNQCMSFPCELTLRRTAEGIRLFSQPVREIENLRQRTLYWRDLTLLPGEHPLDVSGELFDIRAEFEIGDATACELIIRGAPVSYDAVKGELSLAGHIAPLKPLDGKIRLQALVDRSTLEVFGNDGAVALQSALNPDESVAPLAAFSRGGESLLKALDVYELRSIWR
jgi:sucrose-6-phosphate hydrolase SacC (GH32 family)